MNKWAFWSETETPLGKQRCLRASEVPSGRPNCL
ncbi:MAG: F0F1 ATP synthase subunit A, partial [Brucella intermedia]